MKSRLKIYFLLLLFWMCFFIISKFTFLLFHYQESFELTFSEWLKIILYGLRLDFASAGYLMLFPGILIAAFLGKKSKWFYHILNIYIIIILTGNILLLISDIELYTHWKFRLDATPLRFLSEPAEAFASTTPGVFVRQIVIGLFLFTAFYIFFKKFIAKKIKNIPKSHWVITPVFLAITALSFIQMRGGFSIVPINVSSAYHSNNMFANHASINVFWNVGHSLLDQKNIQKNYIFFEESKAKKNFAMLFQRNENPVKIFKTDKPNIVLLILESFTSKVIKPLGGLDSITPNLNALIKEGILFSNCFASGDRSDKGIVAILSGFPAIPDMSVLQYPGKIQQLPFLTKDLEKENYTTTFYYGGNPNFANIKTYLLNADFKNIISNSDFSTKEATSKWGVPDHTVFEKLYKDIINSSDTKPFFKAFFTLSSHDPFDIPEPYHFNKKESNAFLSSVYYTDKAIGNFFSKIKKTKWWDKTVFILIADHGSLQPGNTGHFDEQSFRIPLLFCGGALSVKDTIISSYISQTDMAYSLLLQTGFKSDQYLFSNNIFSNNLNSFSFYTFNNGFGIFSDSTSVIWDHSSKTYITFKGKNASEESEKGKAILQNSITWFFKQNTENSK